MTVLKPDMFVKAVPGHDELISFTYGFVLEAKAVAADAEAQPVVRELDNGDLLIEGYAADFSGLDREGENFAPGAFEQGIQNFLTGQAALCFHHKTDHGLGKVLDLREEGKGLFMKARVDYQPESSPLRYIYNAVKKGSYNGLSVGGFFQRAMGKIANVDMTEISITPVPVHPGTNFAVVAGKALELQTATAEPKTDESNLEPVETALEALGKALDSIERLTESKSMPKSHDPRAADLLGGFLTNLSTVRSFAGAAREFGEQDDLISLGDEVETQCVKWEATAHKLAAKIGPVPVQSFV